jgi:hypothetical protein
MNIKGHVCIMNIKGHVCIMNIKGHVCITNIKGHVCIMNIKGHVCIMNIKGHVCIMNIKGYKTTAFASYKTTVIHTVYCEARLNFMNCYLHRVHAGEIDCKLILFSDNDWFLLSGYINS